MYLTVIRENGYIRILRRLNKSEQLYHTLIKHKIQNKLIDFSKFCDLLRMYEV